MIELSSDRFEVFVLETMESLPEVIRSRLENVQVVIDETAPPGTRRAVLGLYEGVPLPRRDLGYSGVLPDKITIFKHTIEALCQDEREVRAMTRETVIHEFAHYFGFSEEKIRRAGY